MQQQIDEFTILLPHSTDMRAGDLEVYSGLDRLWRMVERYQMTSPISISVIDNKAGLVRAIGGNYDQATGWNLKDEKSTMAPALAGNLVFPLTIRVQDAKGNILKMKLQVRKREPENSSSCQKPSIAALPHN